MYKISVSLLVWICLVIEPKKIEVLTSLKCHKLYGVIQKKNIKWTIKGIEWFKKIKTIMFLRKLKTNYLKL